MQKEQKVMAVMAVAVMVMVSTMAVIKITAPPTNMNLPDASQYDTSYDSYLRTVGINSVDYRDIYYPNNPEYDKSVKYPNYNDKAIEYNTDTLRHIDANGWLRYFSYVPTLSTTPVNWNSGKLYPIWQDGTFRIRYIKAHPSSAGHVGGTIKTVECYTDIDWGGGLLNTWTNKGSAIVLVKFVGIFPYAVAGREFPAGNANGMTADHYGGLVHPKVKISLDCGNGFTFGANGIYMIGVFFNFVHVVNFQFVEENDQFFTMPFGIS